MITKELRARAEDVARMTQRDIEALVHQDVHQIVHELQVHQIELEMQNESLRGAQLDIESSRAQYQELFDYAPIGYVMLDAGGSVIRANEASLTLLRVARTGLIGQRFCAFVASEDMLSFEQQLLGASNSRRTCEVRLRSQGQRTRHARLDISVVPSRSSDRLIALTDISEQKRSVEAMQRWEQELEARVAARTRELADLNRLLEAQIADSSKSEAARRELEARLREAQRFESLGALAGGIAHDFNNLLVGVVGNAELLLLRPELSIECREPLVLIKHAGRRASDLTRQLLMFAGQGRLIMDPVRLPKIVAENLELLRTRLPAGIQLQALTAVDVPEIEADRSQVNQVVMNLILNAIEALDERGTIVIQTRAEELDADKLAEFQHANTARPGRFVVLRVRDGGPGMDAATLTRIFDPFFTTKFAGRGLGLASVLGITQGHHGALRVQSEPGKGASFEVAFPVAETRRESERPRALQAQSWQGNGSVLLVDDDDAVRRVVAKMLTQLGFDVTAANGGEAGLDMFLHAAPGFKFVVLDWIMPGFSGKQLLDALRELDPHLPIVLISGYSAEDLGSYDHRVICVQKPMTLGQLRDAVCQLLGEADASQRTAKLSS